MDHLIFRGWSWKIYEVADSFSTGSTGLFFVDIFNLSPIAAVCGWIYFRWLLPGYFSKNLPDTPPRISNGPRLNKKIIPQTFTTITYNRVILKNKLPDMASLLKNRESALGLSKRKCLQFFRGTSSWPELLKVLYISDLDGHFFVI